MSQEKEEAELSFEIAGFYRIPRKTRADSVIARWEPRSYTASDTQQALNLASADGLRYQNKPDVQGFVEIPDVSLRLYL
ncbi:MAG: hypothetical protein KGH55_02485 [Nanoarchaeota archaeon]|nr:hypothetical protein [Nanoarchaeota archaeon]